MQSKNMLIKRIHSLLCVGYNITDRLASYLLMALDPNGGKYIHLMKDIMPEDKYKRLLSSLQEQYEDVMKRYGFASIVDLFHAIALECKK